MPDAGQAGLFKHAAQAPCWNHPAAAVDRGALELFRSPPRWPINREELIAALREPHGPREWFAGQVLASTSPPVLLRPLAAPGWSRFVAPIVVGKTPVGYLSIVETESSMRPAWCKALKNELSGLLISDSH